MAINIVILGESGVGKTRFLDQWLSDSNYTSYLPFSDPPWRSISVDNKEYSLNFMDLNATLLRNPTPGFRSDVFVEHLQLADGVVFLYDITNKSSFTDVAYEGYRNVVRARIQLVQDGESYPGRLKWFGAVLVGNKNDLEAKREVKKEMAEEWAQSLGLSSFVVNTMDFDAVEETVRALVRSIQRRKDFKRKAAREAEKKAAEEKGKKKGKATLKSLTHRFGQSGSTK